MTSPCWPWGLGSLAHQRCELRKFARKYKNWKYRGYLLDHEFICHWASQWHWRTGIFFIEHHFIQIRRNIGHVRLIRIGILRNRISIVGRISLWCSSFQKIQEIFAQDGAKEQREKKKVWRKKNEPDPWVLKVILFFLEKSEDHLKKRKIVKQKSSESLLKPGEGLDRSLEDSEDFGPH